MSIEGYKNIDNKAGLNLRTGYFAKLGESATIQLSASDPCPFRRFVRGSFFNECRAWTTGYALQSPGQCSNLSPELGFPATCTATDRFSGNGVASKHRRYAPTSSTSRKKMAKAKGTKRDFRSIKLISRTIKRNGET